MAADHNLVGWFEIPCTDIDRAQQFYENVFQIKLERYKMGDEFMAWFPAKPDVYGTGGTLIQGPGYVPSTDGCQLYFTAPDIEATLARVSEGGGEVLVPLTSIGDHGYIGILKDTEGNKIGLHMNVASETTSDEEEE